MPSSLPEPRPARPEDAERVAGVLAALEASLGHEPATAAGDVRQWWSHAELDRDSWLFEEDGRVLGIVWLFPPRRDASPTFAVVHPDARDRGLGDRLLELAEQAARDRGLRVVRTDVFADDEVDRALHEARGYREARRFYEMRIDLDGLPPEPAWPDGIRVAPFRREDARAFYDASNEAFREEWGFAPMPFDEWLRRRVDEADTSLYFVAWDGDEIAGMIRCESEHRGVGWVGMLGVRERWRRRGIGEALLRHAFRVFYDRGRRSVGLGVDAENATGATRLYERAGMRVRVVDIVYEKEVA